jgi:hypothetical protein
MSRFARDAALGLVAAFVLFPASVSGITAVLYVADRRWHGMLNRDEPRTLLWGLLIAFVLWLVMAFSACRRFARAESASPRTYGELRVRLDQLASRVHAGCPGSGGTPAERQAREQLDIVAADLAPGSIGLRWLTLTGYVDAWRRLHRIEEALLQVEAEDAVLAEALSDALRLQSSAIPQHESLLTLIRTAVRSLSPTAARFIGDPPAAHPAPADDSPAAAAEARAALVEVRNAVNQYRDARRAGLVHARNNVLVTVVWTGLTAYALLVFAILGGASRRSIGAAAVFYLVGALVGLFKQLRSVSAADHVLQDDFGLSIARLVHTPLFSGLAALGGVVLVHMLDSGDRLSLAQIFNLRNNEIGLVTAAIFGLTPALLIQGLQKQVERYKAELRASEPAEAKPPETAALPATL